MTYWIKNFVIFLDQKGKKKEKKYEMIICHNLGVVTVKPLRGRGGVFFLESFKCFEKNAIETD